jgi:hypothetical protein
MDCKWRVRDFIGSVGNLRRLSDIVCEYIVLEVTRLVEYWRRIPRCGW